MVSLFKDGDTIGLTAGSQQGSPFLQTPRTLTFSQFPEGYSIPDDVHVIVELDEGNLVLFRWDNVEVNGQTFISATEFLEALYPSSSLAPAIFTLENAASNQDFYSYNFDTSSYDLVSTPSWVQTSATQLYFCSSKENPGFMVCCINHARTGQPNTAYTIDGGQTWSTLSYGRYWTPAAMSENGQVALTILTGTDRQYNVTTNGGVSWSRTMFPVNLTFPHTPWINYDGSFIMVPTFIYAGIGTNSIGLWYNNRTSLIMRSWPHPGLPNSCFAAKDTVYTTSNPNRIWGAARSASDPNIYYSDDMGISWNSVTIDSGFSSTWTSICGDSTAQFMYVYMDNGTSSKIYASSDYGANWSEITPPGFTGRLFQFHQPIFCDHSGQYLYVVKQNSTDAYYSSDYGASWTSLTSPVTNSYSNIVNSF